MALATSGAVTSPDFAYPQTVSKNAGSRLTTAISKDDSPATLRALIDYYLAESMIDPANIPSAIGKIASVRATATDPATITLATLLEADIYARLYTSDMWVYNRRDIPLTPLPPSYREWSGAQFRLRVSQLADSAIATGASLSTPLSRYEGIITQDSDTRIFCPTIGDFTLRRAISLLSLMRESTTAARGLFPTMLLNAPVGAPFLAPGDPTGTRILDLYSTLISHSRQGSAPHIAAEVDRIGFICDNLATPGADTRSEALMRLYSSYTDPATGKPADEWAGEILCAIPPFGDDNSAGDRTLYDAITTYLATWPNFTRRNCLENTLHAMEARSVQVTAPQAAGPGRETEFKVRARNVGALKLNIYDVSSSPVFSNYFQLPKDGRLPAPAAVIEVPAGDERVPFTRTVTARHTFTQPGTYIIVPDFEGASPLRRQSWQKIYVSGVALAESRFDRTAIWAIDPVEGAPLEGVDIFMRYDSRSSSKGDVKIGSTGTDGSLTIAPEVSGTVTATLGADRFAMPQYAYSFNNLRPGQWQQHVRGYSDLQLYHPGDTARWVAVIYECKDDLRRPCAGASVEAIVTDPSGVNTDTIRATADRWGRVAGSVVIPEGSLTGTWSMRIDDSWRAVHFTVADYKLPTFIIDGATAERGVPEAGAVTLSGLVRTYAGFPLEGAKVTAEISVTQRPRWWMPGTTYRFCSADTVAGPDGRFSIPLSAAMLDASPIAGGYFTARITATSPSGESQQTEVTFTTGDRYLIKASVPAEADVTSGRLNLSAETVDSRDSVAGIPVEFRIINADSAAMLTGSIESGSLSADVKSLPSGRYTVEFTLPAPGEAEPVRTETLLYRTTDTATPCPGTLLWSPMNRLETTPDGRASWLYATDCPTHLLVTLTTSGSIASQRWVKVKAGMGHIDISLPDDAAKAHLTVSATGLYRSATCSADITRAGSERGIKILTETFRDRLEPGSREKWTLRVVDLEGRGREAAVVADLYNTALDAIASQTWDFTPAMQSGRTLIWDSPEFDRTIWSSRNATPGKNAECRDGIQPDFNTYGHSLAGMQTRFTNGIMVRGAQMKSTMSSSQLNVVREHKAEVAVEESADAAPMDAGAGADMQESIQATDKTTYRDSEVPLAFFRPDLTTGSDGSITLDFTLPDANTTWGFRAVAWTDSILTTTCSADVVASKSVMVQPNLPRFMRAGDRADVQALVMNATDSTLTVATTVEIFNPADGDVIKTHSKELVIDPHSSATIDVNLVAPADAPFTGYRIKATADGHSDGEQALIPLLPATAPTVETHPFYIAPDSTLYSTTLPSLPSGGRLTLQLCENPLWYVVTALPGIADNQPSTAPQAAAALFSAAVSAGIVNDNPAIADAIAEWERSGRSEQTLVSMLSRNEELKTVLLSATPWMNDAHSDTERMARLSLLLDTRTTSRAIASNISMLKRLYSDGGWSWCGGYRTPSSWATHRVLVTLGHLASLGYLPADKELRSMLSEALSADTREARKLYARSPKDDFTAYVALHDLYSPAGIGGADQTIVTATVNRVVRRWKKDPLAVKATDALLLHAHGYRTMARTVMGSVREFEKKSPDRGTWFPSLGADAVAETALILRAFATVDPGCDDIDGLRQWLMLEKSAQDWGNSTQTTEVIATMLTTSGRWIVPASGCEVTVDNHTLQPTAASRLTGDFIMPLPHTGTLTITKNADTPAWGAIFAQYTDSLAAMKASACAELSIEKHLLLSRPGADPVAVNASTPLHPGDRVRVNLTIKATQTMDYVAIIDERAACLEPVDQVSGTIFSEGLSFYRENRDTQTRLFIDHLPAGVYILSYDMWVNNDGVFTAGPATVQSQYAPRFTARSAGSVITVNKQRQ